MDCHICGNDAGEHPEYIRRRKKASAYTPTGKASDLAPVCKTCHNAIIMSACFGKG